MDVKDLAGVRLVAVELLDGRGGAVGGVDALADIHRERGGVGSGGLGGGALRGARRGGLGGTIGRSAAAEGQAGASGQAEGQDRGGGAESQGGTHCVGHSAP